MVALKLTDNENKEGEIVLFDYETPETEVLAPNFIEFLNQILQNPKPVLQELKGWENHYKPLKTNDNEHFFESGTTHQPVRTGRA